MLLTSPPRYVMSKGRIALCGGVDEAGDTDIRIPGRLGEVKGNMNR